MKKILIIAVIAFLSMSANAAKIDYTVVSGASGNAYTTGGGGYVPDPPLAAASGDLTYNPDNELMVGYLAFTNIFTGSGQDVNQEFGSNIGVDFGEGGDIALFGPYPNPWSEACVDFGTTAACGDLYASIPVLDNNAMSVLSGDLAAGGTVVLKWFIGGAPSASSFNTFTLQQVVPVPAAVWLFGSALGLLGWMRRRTA